jgi:stearoyl-CoA desaturase (delta-9 desaturase)
MFTACAMSITLGYHRLFAHGAYKAHWLVKLVTLIFGAAAYENSALMWTSEHRKHHKHVDHEDDPYDISRGFFYAHIGWLFLRFIPHRELDNVQDLRKDRMVMWQHNYVQVIATIVSFVVPMIVGYVWDGWKGFLGCLIIVGFLRVVCVHHVTFFINSFCHMIGNRPYSSTCSARDSWLMAIFTFGEGYHNYHHEFQHDYRNGVKPWQWDPTKWMIWLLSKLGLAYDLREVPEEKILLAQIQEKQRSLKQQLEENRRTLPQSAADLLASATAQIQHASEEWEKWRREYTLAKEKHLEHSREKIAQIRKELNLAAARLRDAIRAWNEAHRGALLAFTAA